MAPYTVDMVFPTAILVVNTLGLALSLFAIIIRFCARYVRKAKLRIFTLGLIASENYCVTNGGVGQNASTVDPNQLLNSGKQLLVSNVCDILAVTLVKISILDFLLSIFSIHDNFRITAFVLMGATVCYGLSCTVATLAACQPFEANWDKVSYPSYKCIDMSVFYIAQTATGAALDILILLTPIPIVWGMSGEMGRKVGLTFLFSVGILVCAISLVRLYYSTKANFILAYITEYAGIAVILSALEANLSILCACLPSFPALLRPLFKKIKSTISSEICGTSKAQWPTSSARSRRHKRGSANIGRAHEGRGPEDSIAEDDMECARRQNHFANDKLYPLSMTATTISAETMEMPILGGRVAFRGSIR
ncbi:hypothetical protein VPNG_02566 [Cytospora leucostoma]|uniref:Rhodopsin domain-containing protein n=1 Tax=Cytospora leucostoma TaxID=1230097 RepID=A0A423XIG0_9PEZI|nr:hypothetical protein VPNG_02566 [Cytospora leucostoma]